MTATANVVRERPVGVLIRRRRRHLGWTIENLATRYLINLGRLEREEDAIVDWDEHPLALNEKDIGRLERGESVKITLAKLRLLCQTLRFTSEETARILTRAQNSAYIDLQEDMARVMETLYFAAVTLLEHPASQQAIVFRIGERTVDDLQQQEVLRIVHSVIGDLLRGQPSTEAAMRPDRAGTTLTPSREQETAVQQQSEVDAQSGALGQRSEATLSQATTPRKTRRQKCATEASTERDIAVNDSASAGQRPRVITESSADSQPTTAARRRARKRSTNEA